MKSEVPWRDGIWFGLNLKAQEHLIGTNEGVVRAHAVRRKRDEERWDQERVLQMQGTPEHPIPGQAGDTPIGINHRAVSEVPVVEPKPRKEELDPRKIYLRRTDFEAHEFTTNCKACRNIQAGARTGMHTDECRKKWSKHCCKQRREERY